MRKVKSGRMRKIATLMILDFVIFFISYYFAFLLRFNFAMPNGVFWNIGIYIFIAVLIKLLVFILANMYSTLWRYASIEELFQIALATFIGNVMANIMFMAVSVRIPISVMVLCTLLDFILVGGSRILYRAARRFNLKKRQNEAACKERVLIFGAGDAGFKILKELLTGPEAYEVVGFLDDDPFKKDKKLNGIPVFGGRECFKESVEKNAVSLIIIACPSMNTQNTNEVAQLANETGVPVKILPNLHDILNYDASLGLLRDLQIEDLLNRDEVVLDKEKISAFIKGKIIMVTGGGGSIGSELCRQIIHYAPKKMVIVDMNENALYYLELELQRYLAKNDINLSGTTITTEIASVRDRNRVDDLFRIHQPQVIFHAAAHKHVPLMEKTPKEAVKNNIFGTKNLLDACVRYSTEKFVQISTDKAVNPTNVMGTTKRVCEMLVQAYNQNSSTDFVAVRFGNVLGSNGSVIPIFKEQLARGGPLTVTDKKMNRFFMTIPEAAQLVLQAGSLGNGGEIFVLDMGDPVKIIDLAENMIRLSGFEPYTEIPITFTGLRPGEKLYEELSYDLNGFDTTRHKDIFIESTRSFDKAVIEDQLAVLRHLVETGKDNEMIDQLVVMVPDYTPNRP